jgi:hypothetical protein
MAAVAPRGRIASATNTISVIAMLGMYAQRGPHENGADLPPPSGEDGSTAAAGPPASASSERRERIRASFAHLIAQTSYGASMCKTGEDKGTSRQR